MNKKVILILALSRSPWIGGIYYKINIIHMLLCSDVKNRYKIVVLVNKRNAHIFEVFGDKVTIEKCTDSANIFVAFMTLFKCYCKYQIKYIFPIMPCRILKKIGIIPVSWIADFQHCYFPEYFEERELNARNKSFSIIAKSQNPLVLSSYDSYSDLQKFFNADRENVFIVHFTSFIQKEINQAKECNDDVLNKYKLSNTKYCIICNQFWAHKNHLVVFEAIKIISNNNPNLDLKFVFTGELSDRRNPEYIKKIIQITRQPDVSERVQILGFIDRIEQLVLMKNASFIIQPSLFEGWGTTVEDAKVLGKIVLLSNIPVHKEQMDINCKLFKKNDAVSLVNLILSTLDKNISQIRIGDKTKKYSTVLEQVFK